MRKIQPENLKIMISNLTEAAGDLCELEARLDYAVTARRVCWMSLANFSGQNGWSRPGRSKSSSGR